jgi:hypothetical protein
MFFSKLFKQCSLQRSIDPVVRVPGAAFAQVPGERLYLVILPLNRWPAASRAGQGVSKLVAPQRSCACLP